MGWRIDIKPDNIAQLVDEFRVVGKLELMDPVRLETMRAPDALDRTRADTDGFRHHSSGPVRRLGGQIGRGKRHNIWRYPTPRGGMREGRVLSSKRPS